MIARAALLALALASAAPVRAQWPFLTVLVPGRMTPADLDIDGRDELVYASGNTVPLLARLAPSPEGARVAAVHVLRQGEHVSGIIAPWPSMPGRVVAVVDRGADAVFAAFSGPGLVREDLSPAPKGFRLSAVADIDADGQAEALGIQGDAFFPGPAQLFDVATGALEWTSEQPMLCGVGAAPLDADPAYEIVLLRTCMFAGSAPALMLDGATRLVEHTFPGDLPALEFGEFDGDPATVDLLTRSSATFRTFAGAAPYPALDTLSMSPSPAGRHDFDGDGIEELMTAAEPLQALRLTDGSAAFTYPDPSLTAVWTAAVAALDDDAGEELAVFGTALDGLPRLRIVDTGTQIVEASADGDVTPFSGVLAADVDNDGADEVAFVSRGDFDAGSGGRVFVVDAADARLANVSQRYSRPDTSQAAPPMVAAQLDADPALELVAGASWLDDGRLAVFDGADLAAQWTATLPQTPNVHALAVVPSSEPAPRIAVLAGDLLRVLHGAGGALAWESSPLPLTWPLSMAVGALDESGTLYIAVLGPEGARVFNAASGAVLRDFEVPHAPIGAWFETRDDTCVLVVAEARRLVRRHCGTFDVLSERALATPVLAVQAPAGSYGALVLSDGNDLLLQEGRRISARGELAQRDLAANNRLAVREDAGAWHAYAGNRIGVHRAVLAPSLLHEDGFE